METVNSLRQFYSRGMEKVSQEGKIENSVNALKMMTEMKISMNEDNCGEEQMMAVGTDLQEGGHSKVQDSDASRVVHHDKLKPCTGDKVSKWREWSHLMQKNRTVNGLQGALEKQSVLIDNVLERTTKAYELISSVRREQDRCREREVALRLYSDKNSATLMTSDRGSSGGAELELNKTPVTPKSAALNPNASVFLSVKSSTPGAHPSDTGQFEPNDSGIGNTTSSTSDYSYTNGDISADKSDAGVFSPTSDSPFQVEFNSVTDNHNFNENNSVELFVRRHGHLSGQYQRYGDLTTSASFCESSVPMTEYSYSNERSATVSACTVVQLTEPFSDSVHTNCSPQVTPTPHMNRGGEIRPTRFKFLFSDGETEGSVADDQLRHVLKNQLESYFSRENLSNDSYLQSQMDADQYVPVATVANLDQIQKLTSETQLIVELLRESTFVQVDEKGEKVRPNHNRCIVILREIAESTPVQDVQALFAGANCPKFVSCEFAHNSNWYVTFDSDSDAQRAYQYLREEVRTFLGKPIMARIKAKPLIRTYQPRNGYINKRFQPPPVPTQIQTEVVTSSAPQPQFTATQPFTLMPNVSQYLNGQQAIPFYPPPPSPLLQAWTSPTTIMDPSMVLAMNGYQATSVNVNSQVNNRNMFNTVNRTTNNNNSRNQKQHGNSGQPMGRDRINSNDSLPPRLQHQQHERQQNSANNMHKTSQPISNHAPVYQGRRADGQGHGHISHNNHSNHHSHHGNHSHAGHSTPMSHPHHHPHQAQSLPHHQGHHMHQQSQHLDGNNNTNNNSNGTTIHSRNSQGIDLSQRHAGKSYKSRRRREEDGARPNRSNSSQPFTRDGQPVNQTRPMSIDKFDYEPTSFPPLPGSGNNASSGDVFESKLSDVVKGTAKPQVKDVPKPVSSVLPVSTATTTVTTSKPNMSSNRDDETTSSSNLCQSSSSSSSTPAAKMTTGSLSQQPTVSQQVRCSASTMQSVPDSRAGREPDIKSSKESENRSNRDRPQQQQQSNTDDNSASLSANSVKLSYAQMVQKTKVAEVSANSLADQSDESESEDADSTQAPNRALKEQGQHPAQSSSKPSARGSGKDFSRKDSRENESDSRRDDRDFRKENDYRRDEPREQRINSRRLKENRERRYGDRDFSHRNDRRGRDGPPVRERDGPKPAAAVAK
ncbi:uncharacterized protein LOC123538119 [Mercenaria mercenaria]|uniref:uncharacterized protein LOC123538119 n=1 Tax=Mercenaria mercenaria TaxID=6596 RepID=UPI00234F5FA6|nr:uncharacterized protein LOC123538119 [Mercenaria mercenaria]